MTAATSSGLRLAQRPSKWAVAVMVALVSAECPKPMVCPISCVSTSDMLHCVHTAQTFQPLFIITLPLTMRLKVVPLTTGLLGGLHGLPPPVQNPPIARMPLQPLGSVISSNGSLKTMRLVPQPAKVSEVVRPPSSSTRPAVGTSVHAASAASTAARESVGPILASPVESMR